MDTSNSEYSDRIAVGVAGWSYPDWDGYVYSDRHVDKLRYVSGFVDVIEVNSTFYRPPEYAVVESWIERTMDRPHFFFAAKLHQDFTHRGLFDSAMIRAFQEGFRPMIEAGRLRHMLAQFPWHFADSASARTRVEAISSAFGSMAHVTFEMRHNSWQSASAMKFIRELGAGTANVDCPLSRHSFNLDACVIHPDAYLRLHGRNRSAWFSRDAGRDETYNYLYSDQEVEAIAQRAARLAGQSSTLTVIANNHYQGKELVNALQLKSRLAGARVKAPATLIERYPVLANCADPVP